MSVRLTISILVGAWTLAGCATMQPSSLPVARGSQGPAGPSIPSERRVSPENIKSIEINPLWQNYGGYLQHVISTVQQQWERALLSEKIYPPAETEVTIRFLMNDRGEVARIISVAGTTNELGRKLAVSAITSRAPYGRWTAAMKEVLGTEQEMTFRFYYQ